MSGKTGNVICNGNIDTEKINNTHQQIKLIVTSYKDVNLEVQQLTQKIKEDWVGDGSNEFESQYNLLIRKIDDFGETLEEIYNNLVDAEAQYEALDDEIRQKYAMSMKS